MVSEYMPHLRSVTMGVWVWSGTRFEPAGQSGIAHFLEHAVFKGTENRNAYEIAQSIESLGGYLNAFTGRELNCYFARIMDSDLPVAIEVIGDLLQYSRFDQNDIEKEKMVVIEEIRGLEDNPEDLVSELYTNLIWQNHNLGRPILGDEQSISKFTPNDLVTYLKNRYRNENIYIIAAGHLDHKELVDLVQKYYDFPGIVEEHQSECQLESGSLKTRILSRDISQAHLCLGGIGIPYSHSSKYTLFLLNAILGGGMTSRLFQRIREDSGLAYSIYSDVELYQDTGQICISAGVDPSDAQKTIEMIRNECDILRKQTVQQVELDDARSQLIGSLYLSLEESGSVMNRLARMEIYDNSYSLVDETVRHLESVTTSDIIDLGETIFAEDNTYLAAVGPLSEEDINT